jgi:hypothetical protein
LTVDLICDTLVDANAMERLAAIVQSSPQKDGEQESK